MWASCVGTGRREAVLKRVVLCAGIAILAGLTPLAPGQATQPAGVQDEPALQPLGPLDDQSLNGPGLVAEDPNKIIGWPAEYTGDSRTPQAPNDVNSRPQNPPTGGIVPIVTRIPEPASFLLILGGLLALRTRR
jgi:hypothetical protein